MIIDDEKTTHFNDFFRRHDMIITSRTNVREMVDHDLDHDLSTFMFKRRNFSMYILMPSLIL